jgi:signal transduction histidine kinase
MADRQRLQQVLLNLLSNAVKYNHEGGAIHVSCLMEDGSARVRIAIGDTGRGIAPEMLPRVFASPSRPSP